MSCIDLHSHSTHSDGRLTPAALIERALAAGVTHLGLTDHDTVSGLAEARAAAGSRLTVVPGIEMTCGFNGREFHLLGLLVDDEAPGMQAFCAAAKTERATRIARMVDRLSKNGIHVKLADVEAEAAGATLARPHLARTLVSYGHAKNMQEAFNRFLGEGTPGWVERPLPTLAEALSVVHAAGGVGSVAHPGVNRLSRHELADLAAQGLDAVEAHHPDHPPSQAEAYTKWAAALGMGVSGGTDFHEDGPEGHGAPGTFVTPDAAFADLEARKLTRAGSRLESSPFPRSAR